MEFRDILRSLDQLDEATKEVKGGRVHTAEPGGYGRQDDDDEDEDEDGKKIKKDKPAGEKRGRGRPPKEVSTRTSTGADAGNKKYSSDSLQKAMGIGKPSGKAKVTTKHKTSDKEPVGESMSLKGWFDKLDKELVNEAGLAVQPIPASPQQKQQQQMATKQAFLIKDPANPTASAITTSDPAVIAAAKNGTLSMQKPGAAPTTGAVPATGSGSQVAPMKEEGDKWIQGAVKHPGAFTKKAKSHGMTAKEFANKVLANKKDYPANTEKQAQLAKTLGKMHEAEAPQNFAQASPLSGGGRSDTAFESKGEYAMKNKQGVAEGIDSTGYTPKIGDEVSWRDSDPRSKMMPMPGTVLAVAPGKVKLKIYSKRMVQDSGKDTVVLDLNHYTVLPKQGVAEGIYVKEGMEHNLKAAYHEGKSHGLAKQAYNCRHDDMEESRMYHEGYKQGLDECYGQIPIRGLVGEMGPGSEVDDMASFGAHTPELDEVSRGEWIKQQARKPGDTFKAFGQTMHDSDVLDEFAFESLDSKLSAILEGEEVAEGMTVSISKGQQGAPDSVSVSAQDGEADQLLSIIKSAGLGLFGGEEKTGYGAPQGSTQAPGGIEVVDDHDGMMALMKKLTGQDIGAESSSDYEDEEGEEGSCNECGYMESQCKCDKEVVDEEDFATYKAQMAKNTARQSKRDDAEHEREYGPDTGERGPLSAADMPRHRALQAKIMKDREKSNEEYEQVDEVEDEYQQEFEVAEANAPDSGADNTDADVAGQVGSDEALATADAGADEEEGQVYSSTTEGYYKDPDGDEDSAEDKADKADHEHRGREESDAEEDDKAEEAGEEVKKDIEYDDEKDKDKVDESYANSADDTFEADIDFMTNIISGGLNKRKQTGQTTIPVVASQLNRLVSKGVTDVNESRMITESVNDWKKLAGIQ
jgi:hypothetical protein